MAKRKREWNEGGDNLFSEANLAQMDAINQRLDEAILQKVKILRIGKMEGGKSRNLPYELKFYSSVSIFLLISERRNKFLLMKFFLQYSSIKLYSASVQYRVIRLLALSASSSLGLPILSFLSSELNVRLAPVPFKTESMSNSIFFAIVYPFNFVSSD